MFFNAASLPSPGIQEPRSGILSIRVEPSRCPSCFPLLSNLLGNPPPASPPIGIPGTPFQSGQKPRGPQNRFTAAPRARFPVKIIQPASSPFALLPSPFIHRTSSFVLRTSSTALLPSYFFLLTSPSYFLCLLLAAPDGIRHGQMENNSRQGAQGGEEKLRWVRRLRQRFARNPGNNPEQPGMQPETTFRSRTKSDKICFPGFAKCALRRVPHVRGIRRRARRVANGDKEPGIAGRAERIFVAGCLSSCSSCVPDGRSVGAGIG